MNGKGKWMETTAQVVWEMIGSKKMKTSHETKNGKTIMLRKMRNKIIF